MSVLDCVKIMAAPLAAFAGTAFAYMRIRADEIQNSHQAALLQATNAQTQDMRYPMANPTPVVAPAPLSLGGTPAVTSLPIADTVTSHPSAAMSATASTATPVIAGSPVLLPPVAAQIPGHDTGASAAINAVQVSAAGPTGSVTSTAVTPVIALATTTPSFSTGDDRTPYIIMPSTECIR